MSGGDVRTNATGTDSIKIDGSVSVGGDLVVGPRGAPSTAINIVGSAMVTGAQRAASAAIAVSTPTPPADCKQRGTEDLVSDDILILSGGTYCWDALRLDGNAQIQATGPVNLYVTGEFKLASSTRMTTERPADLTVHVTGTTEVKLESSAIMHGLINAPNARVYLDGSIVVYGAVLGKTVKIKGSAIVHYDRAIVGDGGESSYSVSFLSWRDLNVGSTSSNAALTNSTPSPPDAFSL